MDKGYDNGPIHDEWALLPLRVRGLDGYGFTPT